MLEPIRFILLIPHQDTGSLLRPYRAQLFAAGIVGAYSFPLAVPLALVSQPFTKAELKTLALSLRTLSIEEGREGKITAGEPRVIPCPALSPGLSLFGPGLDLPIPDFPSREVSYRFPSLLLCTALIQQEEQGLMGQDIPPGASFFFRAAMVANMVLRPLGSGEEAYSFEWNIGAPVWLPSYKHKKGL